MALRTTPSANLYRALPLQPLKWESKPRWPRDGDVKSSLDPVTGEKALTVCAQPRKSNKLTGQPIFQGVSFFAPYCVQFFNQIHSQFYQADAKAPGPDVQRCAVLVPNAALPDGVAIVNDGKLSLPRAGAEGDGRINCGEHYTLFATRTMPAAEFEAIFAELVATSGIPPNAEGGPAPGAAPVVLQLDLDRCPADKLTCAAMMALDVLNTKVTDPNMRFFAKLYALHLWPTDTDFEDFLGFGPLARMAATALEAWSVEDVFLMATVCEAQDRLAEVLECKFSRPAYYQQPV